MGNPKAKKSGGKKKGSGAVRAIWSGSCICSVPAAYPTVYALWSQIFTSILGSKMVASLLCKVKCAFSISYVPTLVARIVEGTAGANKSNRFSQLGLLVVLRVV